MTKTELEKLHTKQLLQLLKQSRLFCEYGCERGTCIYSPILEHSIDEIKTVLKTREHVRNKKEAKEYRRLKAQGKL
jgi:hypothetical protein